MCFLTKINISNNFWTLILYRRFLSRKLFEIYFRKLFLSYSIINSLKLLKNLPYYTLYIWYICNAYYHISNLEGYRRHQILICLAFFHWWIHHSPLCLRWLYICSWKNSISLKMGVSFLRGRHWLKKRKFQFLCTKCEINFHNSFIVSLANFRKM